VKPRILSQSDNETRVKRRPNFRTQSPCGKTEKEVKKRLREEGEEKKINRKETADVSSRRIGCSGSSRKKSGSGTWIGMNGPFG
jgi:hypothetical protein